MNLWSLIAELQKDLSIQCRITRRSLHLVSPPSVSHLPHDGWLPDLKEDTYRKSSSSLPEDCSLKSVGEMERQRRVYMTYATNINTNCCSLENSQYYERVIFNNPGLLRVQTGKGKLRFDKRRVDAHVRLLFFIEHYSQSVGDIECIDRNLEKHCPSVCSRYL